ncbi:hypothetical protein SB6412_01756 [Klebsiella pasteurii]|nr:hypothetical protein [Klebsiella sp. 1400]VUS44910.1 hypothetical protein SB6417_01507 [Klebsiella pasteurii]VUS44930.1 hypothetical protein SB6412_01756 [Klebsiella pasteurii]
MMRIVTVFAHGSLINPLLLCASPASNSINARKTPIELHIVQTSLILFVCIRRQ